MLSRLLRAFLCASVSPWLICLFMMMPRGATGADTQRCFIIQVVDDATGRGVPMVELSTVNHISCFTDSAGIVAFDEPGLMNRKVWFEVSNADGYDYPADGLGNRGVTLLSEPGKTATIKIKRINIAQRLYRMTGAGIYRDSVLAGRGVPIRQPLIDGGVLGQDTVEAIVYRGKIRWFFGDTNRADYPLGNFGTSGTTSLLPGSGGLDPNIGIDLDYFVDETGFSRRMVSIDGPGPVWVAGMMSLKDLTGQERLIGYFARVKGLQGRYEHGLIVYNDKTDTFDKLKNIDDDAPVWPDGHPVRVKDDAKDAKDGAKEYLYFPQPYPNVRALADWEHVTDVKSYEALTCLKEGSRYEKDTAEQKIERDKDGRAVFTWKRNTPPLSPGEMQELVQKKQLGPEDCPMRLEDADKGTPIRLHGASVYWNEYLKKWILIGHEVEGKPSNLGEVWFASSKKIDGPWVKAVKIVTHTKMDFYNVTQLPFFDQENGRMVYFAGTYTNTFARGAPAPTPRYEYNEIVYKLDLSDGRLKIAE